MYCFYNKLSESEFSNKLFVCFFEEKNLTI